MAGVVRARRARHSASTLECVRHHSVRKWKDIMRFEIRYFLLEVGLSPKGLRAPVYSACVTILGCVRYYVRLHVLLC